MGFKFENILYEKREGIAWITFNRPEKMNPLSSSLVEEAERAMDDAEGDAEVRVVVFTGSGKAFSAGADISELNRAVGSYAEGRRVIEGVLGLFRRVELSGKPVIAAVNGFAMGGGCELCMASDIVIASDRALFGVPEASIGIMPGFAIIRGPSVIGRSATKLLAMTADHIDAKEAQRMGLVNVVVPPEKLLEETERVARRIAANAPLALEMMKHFVNRGVEEGYSWSRDATSALITTQDLKEGTDAFLGKRKPQFKGK